MIDFAQKIKEIASMDTGNCPVLSIYLNVDGKLYPKKEYEIMLKGLIKEKKEEIERVGIEREKKLMIEKDLQEVINFVTQKFQRKGTKGLVIFSSQGAKFWESFNLPVSVRNMIIIDSRPFIKPLLFLMDEYHRFGMIILDRDTARIFSYYMGTIKEESYVISDVPSRVKMAGWYGLAERRIERHIEDHLQKYIKKVGDVVSELFRIREIEYILLGGNQKLISKFEENLPGYLRNRIAARLEMMIDTPVSQVQEVIRSFEEEIKKGEEKKLIDEIIKETSSKGLGCFGLDSTLFALQRGAVRLLIVREGYRQRGAICRRCGYIWWRQEACPYCREEMEQREDVVDDAVNLSISTGSEFKEIRHDFIFNNEPVQIGALLRFKV